MRYKRILLVAPRFFQSKFRLSIYPLAGLGYISEALETNGFDVSTFDMNLQYSLKDLDKKISVFKPDMIGFTAMTFGHRQLYALINSLKKSYPAIKIVAGGPHISTLRKKVLEECPGLDYGIILEGDLSIVQLCKGVDLDKIQGFIYRQGRSVIMNEFNDFITELDTVAFPRYRSFEIEKYPSRQIGIVTSRGCPYSCIYCPVISAIGKRFRQRCAQNVVDEVTYWHQKGYREMLFLDDNFTLDRKRVEEICALLTKSKLSGLRLKCPNGIRADKVDYELLKKMKAVGFDMIAFGVEAAEDKILKNIKKGETIATIEESIRNACSLGFDVDLFFLMGSPGETLKDVKSSFSLAMRYPIRNSRFYNIIPFPNTELFEWIKKNNYFLHSYEHILNNASHFINEPCFYTPEMPSQDRRIAFGMAQKVTRRIRRNFIERKIKGPIVFKKTLGFVYTLPLVEDMLINNPVLVKVKERLKNLLSYR